MVDSSAIEGEVLDRVSVQFSFARQLGFAADKRRSNPAEAGAAELMADLYRRYAEPLTDQLLFDWHAMLMNGRRDVADVGDYHTHADPMQIASGELIALIGDPVIGAPGSIAGALYRASGHQSNCLRTYTDGNRGQ